MRLEATGKSVDIAIQNGLLECGLTREEVQVKVIDEGGLFKKAKVVLIGAEDETASGEEMNTNAQQFASISVTEESEPNVNASIENTNNEYNVEFKEETNAENIEIKKPKRVIDTARLQTRGQEFLLDLARMIDESATVEVTAGENELSFAVKGEGLGKLIGYHGENINALQLLLSGLKLRSEGPVRMYLDIDGYKSNRNQGIVDLANRVAEQAIKIERNIHLDPMSAYDRRIVHTTLQDRDDVTTESTGEGEKRHVVIKPIFRK